MNFDILNERLIDQFYQNWHTSVDNCEKLVLYKSIKTDFEMESYLSSNFSVKFISCLRFGVLKLNVEKGRYINLPREQRICMCCNMFCIENEYHFIMICPAYRQLRLKYLPRYYCSWPNKNKFMSLMKCTRRSTVYNFVNFLKNAWKLRDFITSDN